MALAWPEDDRDGGGDDWREWQLSNGPVAEEGREGRRSRAQANGGGPVSVKVASGKLEERWSEAVVAGRRRSSGDL